MFNNALMLLHHKTFVKSLKFGSQNYYGYDMKLSCALTSVFLYCVANQCLAAAPPGPVIPSQYDATPNEVSKNDTRVYVGLGWVFGVKSVFETMIGIRSANVDSSGKVSGADVSLNIPLTGFETTKIKAKYINGTTNGQGVVGVGYIFGVGKLLGTAGYSLPYLYAGTDYVVDIGFEPFVNVNTMSKINAPSKAYSCLGVPATLVGKTCNF